MAMTQLEHDRETDSTPTPEQQLLSRAAAWSETRQRLRGAAMLSEIAGGQDQPPIDAPNQQSADRGSETANDVMRSIRLASRELQARRAESAVQSVKLDKRELELAERARELVDFCGILTRRREELDQDARDLRDRQEQSRTLKAGLETRLAELAAGEGESQARAVELRAEADELSLRTRRSARDDLVARALRRQRRCAARDSRAIIRRLQELDRRRTRIDLREAAADQRHAELDGQRSRIALGERELVEREQACLTVERAVARQKASLEGREGRLATRRASAGEAWLRIRAERSAAQKRAARG